MKPATPGVCVGVAGKGKAGSVGSGVGVGMIIIGIAVQVGVAVGHPPASAAVGCGLPNAKVNIITARITANQSRSLGLWRDIYNEQVFIRSILSSRATHSPNYFYFTLNLFIRSGNLSLGIIHSLA
jgi:hypothetical protein